MNDLRTLFIRWYFNQFADLDKLHLKMDDVCEDSPWHRESTVAVHTNMVVGEYLAQVTKTRWSAYDLYGAFACAFHDVGKPAARTEAYKPERGKYYRYGGHELISARLWEDWAVRNWTFLESEFGLATSAIYRVSWLIENHLPWDIKKAEKRNRLIVAALDCAGSAQTFVNIVKADTWGRISDDAEQKRAKVEAWCEEFLDDCSETIAESENVFIDVDSPIMYMPVGVSGSGKSTLFDSDSMECVRKDDGANAIVHFSMDTLRLNWYDADDYANAFKMSCDDKKFMTRVRSAFSYLLETGSDLYLDNMNLSRKSRASYIQEAKRSGYRVYAILLPVDLQTVKDRQLTRTDKTLSADLIEDMYMRLSIPSRADVDRIITYSGNLKKS